MYYIMIICWLHSSHQSQSCSMRVCGICISYEMLPSHHDFLNLFGWTGLPNASDSPESCGSCHRDLVREEVNHLETKVGLLYCDSS